jgi:nitric oxide reductase NorQ protein
MDERIKPYLIESEPYYRAVDQEIELFEAACAQQIPLILKGPTGCGKTRFVEHMAWRLGRPLITVSCSEDLTASDLVGRFLLDTNGTVWHDGPLTMAVRYGAICYLDEIVEARADTTVVIHPLADDRRMLPLDRKGEQVHAHRDFQLVVSYNPGYQGSAKDMKISTKQRFGALDFRYPGSEAEVEIVIRESAVDREYAARLVGIANQSRELHGRGLDEGMSTRMLVRAAKLIAQGIAPGVACGVAMIQPITDDEDALAALGGFVEAHFGP